VNVEIHIDHRVHRRIIGARGFGIRKIMDQFKVDVRFPRQEDEDPDLIVISGAEDDTYDCRDHLENMAEEFVSGFISLANWFLERP
jgi:hypothetical protein